MGLVIDGRRRTSSSFVHAQIGLTLNILASLQPVAALIRILAQLHSAPSPAADGTKTKQALVPRLRRLYHRVIGLLLIVLAAVNITLGLFLMVAPTILWVHWIVYISLVLVSGVLLEVIGGQRLPPAEIQTRASSMGPAGLSDGTLCLGQVARSLNGKKAAAVIRKSRTCLEHLSVPVMDEIPRVGSEDEIEIQFEEPRRGARNLPAVESRERMDSLESQELAQAGI